MCSNYFCLRSHYGAAASVCSPSALDCVAGVTGPDGACLEHCQGSIMGVDRLGSVRNEEGLARYISQYEKFKNQQSANLTFPIAMKGLLITWWENNCTSYFLDLKFTSKLKFVQISFSTSTFDRIQKVFNFSIFIIIIINTSGPSSQVCRPAVSYRRNHGAPHWLLSHQCGGDNLLWG